MIGTLPPATDTAVATTVRCSSGVSEKNSPPPAATIMAAGS
jgi:hypothetical protein